MGLQTANAQKKHLEISSKKDGNLHFLSSIIYKTEHLSESSLYSSLDSVKNKLENIGFFNLEIDTIIKQDSVYKAIFDLGTQIKTIKIHYIDPHLHKEDLSILNPLYIDDTIFEVKTEDLTKTMKHIVDHFEKRGNTFVKATLENISIKNDIAYAKLKILNKTIRTIDKFVINGYTKLSKNYLDNYLNISTGATFDQNKIEKTSQIIKTIPFIEELRPPEVLFTKDSTILYIYLKKKPANKFDGFVGFTSKTSGKGISLNGYLDLELVNILNIGESFSLNWKNNGNSAQSFDLSTSIPFIFNSKNSFHGNLNIYKQDSLFVTTSYSIGLNRFINYRNTLGVLLKSYNSYSINDIVTDTINDYNNTFFGATYEYKLKGNDNFIEDKFRINLEALIGKRKASELNANQSKISLTAMYLLNLRNNNYIFVKNNSSKTFSDKELFSNELMRTGGINSIRGFVEESILSSEYSYFNIEYRKRVSNGSHIYTISDIGFLKNFSNSTTIKPYSFGLGYRFNASFSTIDISYAIGNFSDTTLNFENSIFHVKIFNFF